MVKPNFCSPCFKISKGLDDPEGFLEEMGGGAEERPAFLLGRTFGLRITSMDT